MSTTDYDLLARWNSHADAEAFMVLADHYASMVYGTCQRILGNGADAEDVAQECFEKLAQSGQKTGTYVSAWLHRVATNRALNRIRSEKRRRERERGFAESQPISTETTWNDVYPHVDEALAGLPDKLREPIVQHFFKGRTHGDIASDAGCSRTNIIHRINKGVEEIRASLERKGIMAGAAALSGMFGTHFQVEAAPAALLDNLARIALTGPGKTTAGMAAAAGGGRRAVGKMPRGVCGDGPNSGDMGSASFGGHARYDGSRRHPSNGKRWGPPWREASANGRRGATAERRGYVHR